MISSRAILSAHGIIDDRPVRFRELRHWPERNPWRAFALPLLVSVISRILHRGPLLACLMAVD